MFMKKNRVAGLKPLVSKANTDKNNSFLVFLQTLIIYGRIKPALGIEQRSRKERYFCMVF